MATTLTYGPPPGRCLVHTYKEGLLSAVAHDLRLVCGSWSVTVDLESGQLVARFSTASISVESVMRNGQPVDGVLGRKDFDKIAATARDEVLRVRTWPEATFTAPLPEAARLALSASGGGSGAVRLDGTLTLCGATRPIAVAVTRVTLASGAVWQARARLHQPDFGIKPYTAMLGALKVKPELDVLITVPA
jgi:polyisoprenoid-binding protein YceI